MHLAAQEGHLTVMRFLVEDLGAGVNIATHIGTAASRGTTALYLAASQGLLDAVKCLVKLGADLNQALENGSTPLIIASHERHAELVTWLVKAGANMYLAATISELVDASAEQTAYLKAKAHCSSPGCLGEGKQKCQGCFQVRYCGEQCQLAHWPAHKADCKRVRAEIKC